MRDHSGVVIVNMSQLMIPRKLKAMMIMVIDFKKDFTYNAEKCQVQATFDATSVAMHVCEQSSTACIQLKESCQRKKPFKSVLGLFDLVSERKDYNTNYKDCERKL